ncbi:MAG: L-threonylcarbamoyladenylate synthase [Eubacteriales bacterium]|nr:L-threonylcarbamoyladenylate synthase [Eubacteriales bacterium]
MKTLLLSPQDDENAVKTAARLILAGEVVGMPTETVYGLAANALSGEAVAKIFAAKGRPQDNPLIVHIADFAEIYGLCPAVPEMAECLAEAFWPGPLTMIVPKGDRIPDEVSCGLDTVGVRLPSHPIARALIRESGVPLAAPSANTSGRPSTTTAAHVLRDMDGRIAAILDGGPCGVGVESTVVSLVGARPRLLRPGGVTLEQLETVLVEVEVDRALYEKIGDDVKVSAPGMKYRHYAPKAPVTVVCGDPQKAAEYIQNRADSSTGVLCFDEYRESFPTCTVKCFGSRFDLAAQAREVFDALRAFDETDVTKIYAQCPPDEGLGLAVANRIKKAAGFVVVDIK